jgi:uncharacterized membrane protein
VILGCATAVFVTVFTTLGLLEFWRFHVPAFDLSIFTQGTWLLGRGDAPFFVTIRGLPLFADHSSYILVFLAPLTWIVPTAPMLIVVNVVALAVTAPLAFVVARRAGAGLLLATVTGIATLLAPAIQWNVRDSFHPEVLAIPLVVGAIALLQRDRDGWAIVAVVLALTAKEDAGLLIVPLGLVIAWVMGKRRVGLFIAALGAAAFVVNFYILLPAWSPSGELLYSYRYAALGEGPTDILVGLATSPDVWFDVLTDPRRIGYVAALIAPMPLAVLAPRWLLAGVPALMANLFSGHGYQYDIEYHYTAYLIVVVIIAGAYGAARVDGWHRPRRTKAALAVSVASALVAFAVAAPIAGWASPNADQERIRGMLDQIPDDAAVSAWGTFVPALAERTTIHQFPNPFEAYYYGTGGAYGLLGGDVPNPGDIDFIVLITDSYDDFDTVIDELLRSPEFEVVVDDDPFLLLRRR